MTDHLSSLTRRSALGLIGASLVLPRAGRAGGLGSVSGSAFGTSWSVMAPEGGDLDGLAARIGDLFERIDGQLSPWTPSSAISRFNAGGSGAVSTDPAVVEVTRAALGISELSGGSFDPTVGPLVARWGFGPISVGGTPDWRALSADAGAVSKRRSGVTLDLCGIAKGWALDRAARLAASDGLDDALLDLGGEFVALGRHPGGREWRVAVEPALPSEAFPAVLSLPGGVAAATSGVQAQSYRLGGRIYSHIVDPATGQPASGGISSVTVVAESATMADGWSTALLVAGARRGPELAHDLGISALFISDGPGSRRPLRTGKIADLIVEG